MSAVEHVALVAGNIKVSIAHAIQNTFISSIYIKGNTDVAANAELKDLGLYSYSDNHYSVPVNDVNQSVTSNFTGMHSAQAVKGGLYSTTVFDKSEHQAITVHSFRSNSFKTDNKAKQILILNWIFQLDNPSNSKAGAFGKALDFELVCRAIYSSIKL